MPYTERPRYGKGQRNRCEGISAPYCPPPCCEEHPRPMPMDACHEPVKPAKAPLRKAALWPRPVSACPPPHYSGVVCRKQELKPAKPKCDSVLLQKIVCCEKRTIPRLCTRIVPEGLPECACPPYTLTGLSQSGAQPWWRPLESHGPDVRSHICVSIPVCCRICDGEGRSFHTSAVVEAEVSYRQPCHPADSWRSSVFIVPCVRMTGGDTCSEDGSFCVELEIHLEIYLLRPEPCAMHRPEPPCPELPLYPEPVCSGQGHHGCRCCEP